MAIFIGEERENTAVRAALAASWAVEKEVRPQLEAAFPSIKEHTHVRGVVGVDSGEALLINGGIRGKNDMVSIGQAPNVAAKLSALRGNSKSTIVTGRVYAALHTDQKSTSAGTLMWEKLDTAYVGGKPYNSYGCGYFRPPS